VGFVTATLDTTQLQGVTVKAIIVKTNDPRTPTLILTVRTHILGSVEVLPQSVIYMRRRPGQSAIARCLIRQEATERGTLSVSDLVSSDERLVATAHKLEQPRPRSDGLPQGKPGDWLLEIRFRDELPVYGKVAGTVDFRTALSRQPRVTVEVESNLRGSISLSTPRLVLVPAAEGEARGTVFASVQEGVDARELRVVADPPELEVALQPSSQRLVKVKVRWGGGTLSNASVSFHVGGEILRMPVVWPGP
jgi:hypothetical protein